jgi:flavodoxin I
MGTRRGSRRLVSQAIGGQVRRVGEVDSVELEGLNLLIVGSPTHGGFPTPEMEALLRASLALQGVMVAVFDTRTKKTVFGYAAPRMARRLQKSGRNLVASPEGFFVLGIEGPLMDGEVERAAGWAKGVAASSADRMRSRQGQAHAAPHCTSGAGLIEWEIQGG